MANYAITTLLLLATALYLPSFSHAAVDEPEFLVEGEVYCDKCRAQFMNRLSQPMEGATVKLECRDPLEGKLNYSMEGKTDASGHYSLQVQGDHGDEICDVILAASPWPDCSEVAQKGWGQSISRVTLTLNSGMADKVRRANPLGFMAQKPDPECMKVYKELNMLPPQGF